MGVPLPVNDQAQLPLVARAVTSVGANATDYEECLACQ
jgi:hypothetical protein